MDYCIRYIDLPYTVKAMTVQDVEGFYNIYVNTHCCYEEQQKAIKHELIHISRGDFDSTDLTLEEVENISI